MWREDTPEVAATLAGTPKPLPRNVYQFWPRGSRLWNDFVGKCSTNSVVSANERLWMRRIAEPGTSMNAFATEGSISDDVLKSAL